MKVSKLTKLMSCSDLEADLVENSLRTMVADAGIGNFDEASHDLRSMLTNWKNALHRIRRG